MVGRGTGAARAKNKPPCGGFADALRDYSHQTANACNQWRHLNTSWLSPKLRTHPDAAIVARAMLALWSVRPLLRHEHQSQREPDQQDAHRPLEPVPGTQEFLPHCCS